MQEPQEESAGPCGQRGESRQKGPGEDEGPWRVISLV